MFRTFGRFLLKHLLLPLLRLIATLIMEEVVRLIFDKIKNMYEKWTNEDIAKAKTDREKEEIKKKSVSRMNDFENAENEILTKMPTIIDEAMSAAIKESNKLLTQSPVDDAKQLPEGKEIRSERDKKAPPVAAKE